MTGRFSSVVGKTSGLVRISDAFREFAIVSDDQSKDESKHRPECHSGMIQPAQIGSNMQGDRHATSFPQRLIRPTCPLTLHNATIAGINAAMQLKQLIAAMEQIAPTRYAEAWDNVGLLAGDPEQTVTRAMLTIDYTSDVADETRADKCDCDHRLSPAIFDTIKRITSNSLIFDAIRRGVAIYSPHTALDVAAGGTNDMLADTMALIDRSPLKTLAIHTFAIQAGDIRAEGIDRQGQRCTLCRRRRTDRKLFVL